MVSRFLFSKARHEFSYGSYRISSTKTDIASPSNSVVTDGKFPWGQQQRRQRRQQQQQRRLVFNRQRPTTVDTSKKSSPFGITVQTRTMSTNFASSTYASAFQDLPKPDSLELRTNTLAYLDTFDVQKWSDEPVSTFSCPTVNVDIFAKMR